MGLSYVVKEKDQKVNVEINFTPNSKIRLPFLEDYPFSMQLYTNGLSVTIPQTSQTYEQLKKGVIIDGVFHDINNVQPVSPNNQTHIAKPIFKTEYRPERSSKDVKPKPQNPFPIKCLNQEQGTETWIPSVITKDRITTRVYKSEAQQKLERLERNLREEPCKFQSLGFGHLKRTAVGARIFFRRPNEVEYNIRLLSLLHQKTLEEISRHKNLTITEEDVYDASNFLNETRLVTSESEGEDVCCNKLGSDISKAVFMSDRLIEGSGAYGVKRMCFHAGEKALDSGKKITNIEDIKSEIITQLENHPIQKDSFPVMARRLTTYQEGWRKTFFEALQENRRWALDTGEKLFMSGLTRQDFEETMNSFQSSEEEVKSLMIESSNYVSGKNYNKLTDMLSDFFN